MELTTSVPFMFIVISSIVTLIAVHMIKDVDGVWDVIPVNPVATMVQNLYILV
jgi:hypothetical protein